MRIQKVSAGRGAAWVNESMGLLKSGGKAVWVPALLIGILSSLPYLGAVLGLVMILFYAGLVLCFDNPNGGYSVFSGFSDGGIGRLLPLIALNIGLAVIALLVLWPSMQPMVEAAMTGVTPGEDEALAMLSSLAKHMLWLIPLGIFLSWITQFAVPLASLKRVSGGEAITLALRAIGANIPALIINFLCLMAVVILTGIVLMIPITLVSAAFAGSPMLANVLVIPLTALLSAVIIALMCGNMLYAYREVFGEDAGHAEESKSSEVLL